MCSSSSPSASGTRSSPPKRAVSETAFEAKNVVSHPDRSSTVGHFPAELLIVSIRGRSFLKSRLRQWDIYSFGLGPTIPKTPFFERRVPAAVQLASAVSIGRSSPIDRFGPLKPKQKFQVSLPSP